MVICYPAIENNTTAKVWLWGKEIYIYKIGKPQARHLKNIENK